MITKKKIWAITAAALIAGTGTVFAQETPQAGEFDVSAERVVQVNVKVSPGNSVAIKVFKENENIVRAIDEKKAGKDGNVLFVFTMPQAAADGTYIFDCGVDAEEAKRFYFNYAQTAYLVNALNADGITAEDVVDLLAENSGNQFAGAVLGFDMEGYNAFSAEERLSAAEHFLRLKNGTAEEDIECAFRKAMGIKFAQKGNTSKGLTYYNPSHEGKAYSDLTDAEKNGITAIFAVNMTQNGDIETVYETASILYKMSIAKSTQMGQLINEYAAKIGLNTSSYYQTYLLMNDSAKSRVHDDMVNKFSGVNTTAGVLAIFDASVSTAAIGNGTPGRGGGSTGGGGTGGTGGGIVSKPAISAPAPIAEEKFSDLAGYDWAKDAITKLAEMGIVAGYENGTFLPSNTVKREEFVKMAVCMTGKFNENAVCNLADVDAQKWYAPYIASAAEAGVISGIDENNFGIGMEVSRQDMAVIVYRCLKLMGAELTPIREYTGFGDEESISGYAKESVAALYTCGLINGLDDGNFCPHEKATRAQAAKVLADAIAVKGV